MRRPARIRVRHNARNPICPQAPGLVTAAGLALALVLASVAAQGAPGLASTPTPGRILAGVETTRPTASSRPAFPGTT